MNPRIQDILTRQLDFDDKNYDPETRLLANFPPDFFTPECLAENFRKPGLNGLHSYRESLYYALNLFWSDRNVERANDILSVFCRDAITPEGNMLWFAEETRFRDGNGNFFNCNTLMPILADFSDKLRPEIRSRLNDILKNIYANFFSKHGGGSLTYVNPRLGHLAMACEISEFFHLPSFEKDVTAFLEYADFLLNQGINETLTPTYYGVDIAILCGLLDVSHDNRLIDCAKMLLNKCFIKQMRFFADRFPVPFRRGYNGDYRTKQSGMAYLFYWTDICPAKMDYQHGSPYLLTHASECHPDLEFSPDKTLPRSLSTHVFEDCCATSYLTKDFSLGSFCKYPCRSIVWQCVTSGGSGWQDGTIYLTLENPEQTAGILRLEAVDEKGEFRCHPYEGDFTMAKIGRLYPFRSFPPEPHIRCVQKENALLCLFRIDRVDAVLQRFGFNFHFARISGDYEELEDGKLLIHQGETTILLKALRRVNMDGSNLYLGNFIEPSFHVVRQGENLECRMDNYDGKPMSFVQNHIGGGFYLEILTGKSHEEARETAEALVVRDEMIDDHCSGHIDSRDAIRETKVISGKKTLGLRWDHYTNESEELHV